MTQLFEHNTTTQQTQELTAVKIREWLVSYVADLLEIEAEEVDVETNFSRYGLDSSAAVILTGDLGNWLGKEIEPTIIYDYPTIASLAEYLV
ncbi:acyl carrier protein [Anabaena aphanizomenioides LEGE 00250]|jgi:acyl carrier protein|uniref:Acyl carrier protein n=1 Tax=Sphaerospermopsis aphanizomenoides LEGE 00250 TaxID=2777972 RepID=A0ABR9VC81_9CYAN|nr:acyl carrier protein [Sphaerospermopsis aphanizomenoides]MBE9235322.1 acyl carrier protein [Sphaerospermopsis aphanizomenoides LEGE 00250]